MFEGSPISTNFPKRTFKSEKFQIDFASGFAGQPFLCRIPLKNLLKMKLLSWMLDSALVAISFKNKLGIICPGQNLIL